MKRCSKASSKMASNNPVNNKETSHKGTSNDLASSVTANSVTASKIVKCKASLLRKLKKINSPVRHAIHSRDREVNDKLEVDRNKVAKGDLVIS